MEQVWQNLDKCFISVMGIEERAYCISSLLLRTMSLLVSNKSVKRKKLNLFM